MSDSKLKNPKSGWWNCTLTSTGEAKLYHASTANVLEKKGLIKVVSAQKAYKPKKEKK